MMRHQTAYMTALEATRRQPRLSSEQRSLIRDSWIAAGLVALAFAGMAFGVYRSEMQTTTGTTATHSLAQR